MHPWAMAESNTRDTLELREVIEGGVNIWDFDYPSYYKGEAKAAFEQKVIDHFYLRQIGAETVGRFLHYFRRTVREIMPLYIQRYESVDLMKDPEIRPLDNYNMIEEYEQTAAGTTTGTTEGSSTNTGNSSSTTDSEGSGSKSSTNLGKSTNVHSDTPEGTLNWDTSNAGNVETINHASDVTQGRTHDTISETSTASEHSESTGTSSDTTEQTGSSSESREDTTKHKLTRRGNIGVTTYAQLLEGYRQTFLNIDMEIINDLETCFLGVY